MFSSLAWAQAATPGHGPNILEQFFPFIAIFVVFYFFMIRPQQRRAQADKKFREDLKRGDSVVTEGGILGHIDGLTDQFVTLQIANGVKIKVLRSMIMAGAKEELEKK
ncbi:MAG: preprotein translocase subunit YajC [Bdellovibrionales bacterium]